MEKLKALPVQMILLIDNLKGEVEEMVMVQTPEARVKACEQVRTSIEYMNGVCSEAAAEVEGIA